MCRRCGEITEIGCPFICKAFWGDGGEGTYPLKIPGDFCIYTLLDKRKSKPFLPWTCLFPCLQRLLRKGHLLYSEHLFFIDSEDVFDAAVLSFFLWCYSGFPCSRTETLWSAHQAAISQKRFLITAYLRQWQASHRCERLANPITNPPWLPQQKSICDSKFIYLERCTFFSWVCKQRKDLSVCSSLVHL